MTGGLQARDTNTLRYGDDWYGIIGTIGGSKGHTGGFYANRELASAAGAIGGARSRRKSPRYYDTSSTAKRRMKLQRSKALHKAYERLVKIQAEAKAQRDREAALLLETGVV